MNYIINPYTKQKIKINSTDGQNLLKMYTNQYLKKSHKMFCPICLKTIHQTGGNNLRESVDCNHLYHAECLKKWGENKPCLQCNHTRIPIYMNYESK